MINNQPTLFLIFTLNGIIIGLLFDFFRILRKTFKTNNLFTYIEDIIFWILTGILILYSIYYFNNGQIRLYMFLGIIIGTIIYILTFSKYVISFSVTIINLFKKILKLIFNFIIKPFKILLKLFKKLFFKPFNFIIINLKKLKITVIKYINLFKKEQKNHKKTILKNIFTKNKIKRVKKEGFCK